MAERFTTDHGGTDTSSASDEQPVWSWDPEEGAAQFVDNLPCVTDVVAAAMFDLRSAWGDDQATMAARLSWLGVETKAQTVRRIEVGAQPPTLEQALSLALMHPGGVRAILGGGQFRVGTTPLVDGDDVESLLLGSDSLVRRTVARDMKVVGAVHRNETIASDLGVSRAEIEEVAAALYPDSSADEQIAERTIRRAEQDDPPAKPGSKKWKSYRAHAVRQVTRELSNELQRLGR
jgi:hypothetical protein